MKPHAILTNMFVFAILLGFSITTTIGKPTSSKKPLLLNDAWNKQQRMLLSDSTPVNQINNKKSALKSKAEMEKEIFQWFRTISEVVHLVSEKHYQTINFPSFIQSALKSAVPTTDAHSSFFSRDTYKSAMESTSGEFSGIGVSIMSKAPEDDSLIVIDVIQGGPSDKAGLQGGDKIVEVNGEALKGLNSDEVINKLRGKTGSTVKLKVIRKKKPMEFKINRDVIKDQSSLCYHLKKQNMYYLSLKIFSETAPKQMANLLEKANRNKCTGIILDLRRNPGGILDPTTIDMAGLFLEKGSLVVSTKNKNKKIINSYHTRINPILTSNVPIFILIDNFTASASEILAGSLKHYSEQNNGTNKRQLMVFLVGTQTFGKGSVQEVIPISNGCALKMTTMLYYLPNDISIQAKGIDPDFVIKPKTTPEEEIKWITELYGKETSLKHHITANEAAGKTEDKELTKAREQKIEHRKKEGPEEEESKEELAKNWEGRHRKAISQDVQIQACVNMINLLNFAKKHTPELVSSRPKALDFLKKHYLSDEQMELEQVK